MMTLPKRIIKQVEKICEHRGRGRRMKIRCLACGRKTLSYHHQFCDKHYPKRKVKQKFKNFDKKNSVRPKRSLPEDSA